MLTQENRDIYCPDVVWMWCPICFPLVEVQTVRAVMLLSIFLSTVAVMVSIVGMKCTRFMDGRPESKSITAMIGGITFMVSGGFSQSCSRIWQAFVKTQDFQNWDDLSVNRLIDQLWNFDHHQMIPFPVFLINITSLAESVGWIKIDAIILNLKESIETLIVRVTNRF